MSSHHDGLPMDSIVKKEEMQPSERERKWESHTSTSQAQTKVLTREDVIAFTEDKQLVDALEAIKINLSRTKEKPNETKERVKLQKVPEIMLRNGVLKEYIKPRELSIGPIYAADPNLYKKELKLKLAAHFIEKKGSTGEVLLEKMKSEIKDIKTYFAKEVIESYTDEELLRLVFLDGCAMLGFIHSYVNKKLDIYNISNGQAALIKQDFFLLENQIPFTVLDVLLDKGESKNAEDLIDYCLIKKFTISSAVMSLNIYGTSKEGMPDHILDLQRRMLSNFTDLHRPRHYGRRMLRRCLVYNCCTCCAFGILVGLGMLIYKAIKCLNKPYDLPEQWSNMQSFRNVQELKAAGIKFKPTDSLETISFRSQFMIRGQLLLPTLVVDNSTARLLLNLVAYEMCKSSHDYAITSYVNLLDLLVDNEQDVKDLRAAGIIRNFLSSDAAAAQLINSIGSNCFPPPVDKYAHVKYNIDRHYKRRCAIWIAQVYHAHFSSPLTVLALVAAIIVLALTAVQTWYAINPKN